MAFSAGTAFLNVLPSMKGFAPAMVAQMKGAHVALAAAGVGIGAVVVGGSIKAFADFDAKMTESLAIMGDVSDTMRGRMSDAARDVAKTTKFSAEEAAESYFFLASAGLNAEQSIAALPAVAAFAQAGNFDMARATDLATDALSALGLKSQDAQENLRNLTRVQDVLVGANTLANASVQQFSEALTNRAGASLRAVGKDVEEGAAVLAAFADQGIKGATAGNQMAIVMRDWQRQAIANSDAFKELGITVFDSSGEMRHSADIIADLEGALEGMSDRQKRAALTQLGFTDRSIAATQALLGTSDAIRGYDEKLRDMGGVTDEVAAKQLETFKEQLRLLKDNLVDVGISIGSVIVPVLTDMVSWMTRSLQPTGNLGKIFDFVGRNAKLLAGIIGGVLAGAIGVKLVLAIRAMTLALAANPFGAIAIAATALAVLIVTNWDTIKEKTLAVFNGIKDFLSKTWDTIKNTIAKIVGDILAFLTRGFATFLEVFVKIGRGILNTAVAAFGWIPGIGEKVKRFRAGFDKATRGIISDLRKQGQEFDRWGEKANRAFTSASVKLAQFNKQVSNLEGLKPINVKVSGGVGDGFGVPSGGSRLATVQAAMKGLTGLYVSSTYRPGAVTASGRPSYHANKANPAVDVGFLRTGASPRLVDILYQRLARTAHRELIWRSAGHYDHLHYAKHGFHGWVNRATGFVAGEAGRERVDITPEGKLDATPGKFKIVGKLRLIDGDAFIEGALERVVGRAG